MTEFGKIVDEIIDYYCKCSPVKATSFGIHKYDSMLDSGSGESRAERAKTLRRYLTRLEAIQTHGTLAADENTDFEILVSNLTAEILTDENYRRWQRDPSLPLEVALFGCYLLIQQESDSREEKEESLLCRLKEIPRLLAECMVNYTLEDDVPTVWAEMGEEMAGAAMSFFGDLLPRSIPESSRVKQEIVRASELAAGACSGYLLFLKEKLTNRSRGTYAVGVEGYDYLLKELHGLHYTSEDLVEIAKTHAAEVSQRMEELAKQLDSEKNSAETLARLKSAHSEGDDLVGFYRKLVDHSREFVINNDLVSVPGNLPLSVEPTPEFARRIQPLASYVPPPAFDVKAKAYFWVTPINDSADLETQIQQRQAHNKYQSLLIALHESYPGHHLQNQHAARVASKVRKLFPSTLFSEGWGLYCEEMMHEEGFYSDRESLFIQLNVQLWRACRVLIDVGLHTGSMSFTEAVNLLVDRVKLDKLSAIAEVKRFCQAPTQGMCYLLGRNEIQARRDSFKLSQGNKFRLRDFHDRLLSFGIIPLNLLGKLI